MSTLVGLRGAVIFKEPVCGFSCTGTSAVIVAEGTVLAFLPFVLPEPLFFHPLVCLLVCPRLVPETSLDLWL